MKRVTVWIVLLVIIAAVFWGSFDFTVNTARGQNLTTDKDFSCEISTDRNTRLFTLKEPAKVTILLQHQLGQELNFPNILQYRDIFSLHVEDSNGTALSENPASTENPTLGYKTLVPGGRYNLSVDVASLYNLSKNQEYKIRAKWKVPVGNKIYKGKSNTIKVKIVSKEDKNIFDLVWQAVQPSCMEGYRPAYFKLVEIGQRAVPVILDWLEMEKKRNVPREHPYIERPVLDVLSQIGASDARQTIAESDIDIMLSDEAKQRFRANLLKRVDIWQSPDRFEKLIQALNEPRLGKKWAIFKLGILGDKRAIPVLEQIVQNDKNLDIRETAKDALTHLDNPDIPMRYIMHRQSERIELKTTKQKYQFGEPIEIHCKLIAGEYGSHKLAEFSKPSLHFLPWGRSTAEPFRLRMQKPRTRRMTRDGMMSVGLGSRPPGSQTKIELSRGMTRHGRLIPYKELSSVQKRLVRDEREPLEGYLDVNDLQPNGNFTLQPGESREYLLRDLSSAFEIIESGGYVIYEFPFGKSSSLSNRITITILATETPGMRNIKGRKRR